MQVATPESTGIPSRAVAALLARLQDRRLNLHSVLLLRQGKLVAEGYAPPWHAERRHRMYSISKSFTSLAVGLMADEGRLTLDDRVADYFPEYCHGAVHPLIAEATLRHMLTMCDCHADTTHRFTRLARWAESWFEAPPTHPAGAVHSYNTTCTNLLCAIVEKLAGCTLMEYLYPRLLEPIGFSPGCVCIQAPDGYSFGGSGVLCTPRDLARLALLCLNGGRWEGRQLISEAYISQATAKQVDNALTNQDIDHSQGYGYQFWRTRHGGFCMYGMGCQLAVCLPEQDLVLVTTGDTQDTSPDTGEVMRALWDILLPALAPAPLPEDAAARAELEAMLQLQPLLAQGRAASPLMAEISGRTWLMAPNAAAWSRVRFEFEADGGRLLYTNDRGPKEIPFGFGRQVKFTFPETVYSGLRLGTPRGSGYEAHASAAWADERTLAVLCYATDDYLGSLCINARFEGGRVTLLLGKTAEGFWDDYTGYMYGEMSE